MKKIFNRKTLEYDDAAIRKLMRTMYKFQINKYLSGRGKKWVMDNFRIQVGLNKYGSCGGLSNRRAGRVPYASCNFAEVRDGLERGAESFYLKEYDHYTHDTEIGSFATKNPDDYIRAVVAHEVAHAVHYTIHACQTTWDGRNLLDGKWNNGYNFPPMKTDVMNYVDFKWALDDHGKCFQYLYRELRVKYVNNAIKYT